MSRTGVPYPLRLPKKVHTAMKKVALAERRSLNAEIVIACERHLRTRTAKDDSHE